MTTSIALCSSNTATRKTCKPDLTLLLPAGVAGVKQHHGLNGGTSVTLNTFFWLSNLKQLNFRHFDTNSEKLNVAVNFFKQETKKAPKRPIFYFEQYTKEFSAIFEQFPIISEDLPRPPKIAEEGWRFSKTTKDVRRPPGMSVDFRRFQRRNTKISAIISFLYLSHMKDVFCLHWADNISMKAP